MIIVVTICSANYLAHAKTLGDSLRAHNPEYHFVVGLVDRLPAELPTSFCHPYELIQVEDLNIEVLPELIQKYDVVELNTAVKPFYIEHLYRRNPAVKAVIYIDPDILVCSSLKPLEDTLQSNNLVLTPHNCTFDNSSTNFYYELGMLTTGVYNLGFLATARSDTTFNFLKWWQRRLTEYCYFDTGSGMCYDQLWMTLAPLYFPGVYVERSPGYNMCYWNHFERKLTQQDGRYFVNGEHRLVFYHFSSFDPTNPGSITKRKKSRVLSFAERPDLKSIYQDYSSRVMANRYALVSSFKYQLRTNPPKPKPSRKELVKSTVRAILQKQSFGIQNLLKRTAQFTLDCFK